ncbi:Methionyl-tRNA formyltransferase [Camellia lanceoleosa]|uniref:Methionyl-tRNA formyltransferase n=1 Tax=Camellia lanceoleosa TaxID=1840588 RepID=A0ACC0HZR3_9ERIC|nr:Methionyl-tRNA formyltransferase [Camellia lanceoleosa]
MANENQNGWFDEEPEMLDEPINWEEDPEENLELEEELEMLDEPIDWEEDPEEDLEEEPEENLEEEFEVGVEGDSDPESDSDHEMVEFDPESLIEDSPEAALRHMMVPPVLPYGKAVFVSASVLDALFNASSAPGSLFEVAAIVTQPPSGRDRGRKVMPSPVAQHALDRGFPSDLIFTPERAGEETFLSNLKALQPELWTVNIHPSLLPLYRGAAPVQRALQDGVKETGVSLAFTVRALDAGPIIACERMEVDNQIKAPDLLAFLFSQGSKLLIHELPSIFDGSARVKALPQDDSQATLAPKISPQESWLSFDQEAIVLHNKGGRGLELE